MNIKNHKIGNGSHCQRALELATNAAIKVADQFVKNRAPTQMTEKLRRELREYEDVLSSLDKNSTLYHACVTNISILRGRLACLEGD